VTTIEGAESAQLNIKEKKEGIVHGYVIISPDAPSRVARCPSR
jgi:hypothetical protein